MKTLAALLLLVPSLADEEVFDIWRLTAPEGATKSEGKGFVSFAKVDGAEFYQIGIYKARARNAGGVESEFPTEWKEIVEAGFTAGPQTKLKPRRLKSGAVAQGATAELRAKNDAPYFGALFVLAPYGLVTSVSVVTSSAASFAKYERAIADVLDSLKLDVDGIAKSFAKAAGKLKAADVPGRWATSRSGNFDPFLMGLHHGSDARLYDLKKDGTYTFHLEAWGGSYRSDEYFIIDENGTYVVDGNKLTLTPQAGATVVKNRAGVIQKKVDPKLETTTYLWQFHYFEGIRENNLVLTPPGETARDGGFASNATFNRSYLLSGTYDPEWTKFGK
jgi:hypothetical protein